MNNQKINIPPRDSNHITRSRLNLKLDSCLEKKITFISAGMGFGKTTLVSNWLEKKNKNCIWLSLDSIHNNINIFLKDFINLIKFILPDLVINFDFNSTNIDNENYYFFLDNFINDLKKRNIQDFIIVIDNLELISNKNVLFAITYIIKFLPQSIKLFIISRFLNINISDIKLILSDTFFISNNDLKFNYDEIHEFHIKKNIKLKYKEIIEISNITEGWALGLEFYSLFYSVSNYSIKNNFETSKIYYELFIAEINKLEPNIKKFIIETSFLGSFSLDLVKNIVDYNNINEIIEYLHRIGFIENIKDSSKNVFKYNNLISNVLEKDLKEKSNYFELIEKSIIYFEKNKDYIRLIEQNFKKADYKSIINIINDNNIHIQDIKRFFNSFHFFQINDILDSEIMSYIYVEYLYASYEYLDYEQKKIEIFIKKAIKKFSNFEIYNLYNESVNGNINSQEKLETFLDLDDENLVIIVYSLLFRFFHTRRDANSILRISTKISNKVRHKYNKIRVNFGFAKYFAITADFTKVEEILNEIISYITKNNFENSMNSFLLCSLCDLIHTNQIMGNKNNDFFIEKFKYIEKVMLYDEYNLVSHYLGLLFDFYIKNNNFKDAKRILFSFIWSLKNHNVGIYNRIAFELFSENKEKLKSLLDVETKRIKIDSNLNMIFSQAFLILNELDKSEYYLSLIDIKRSKSYELIYLTSKAILEYKRNNNIEAKKEMLKALHLTKDFLLVGGFLLTAKSILVMKYYIINDIYTSIKEKKQTFDLSFIKFIKELLEQINDIIHIDDTSNNNSINNLTNRENEILILMNQGLSNKEITEQLFISMTTLKTHISHIFKKLGVKERKIALIFYNLENAKNKQNDLFIN